VLIVIVLVPVPAFRDTPGFFPPYPEGIASDRDVWIPLGDLLSSPLHSGCGPDGSWKGEMGKNPGSGPPPPAPVPSQTQASILFCHCNVANYYLINSRHKNLNCSGRITVFLRIIASQKQGLRQNWYNRAICGAGFYTAGDGGRGGFTERVHAGEWRFAECIFPGGFHRDDLRRKRSSGPPARQTEQICGHPVRTCRIKNL